MSSGTERIPQPEDYCPEEKNKGFHWGWIVAPSILAGFFFIILLIILIVGLVYYSKFQGLIAQGRAAAANFQSAYAESIVTSCQKASFQSTFPLEPFENEEFSLPNCQALLQTSFNVTLSNCENILPITPPPGFTVALRLTGQDPLAPAGATGSWVQVQGPQGATSVYLPPAPAEKMIGYFFYSPSSRLSCVAFTGTWYLSEWKTDLSFPQVPPTALNNYQSGDLMHRGFYNFYLAVRPALMAAWQQYADQSDQLIITGHSLGGALSTICAYDMAGSQNRSGVVPLYHYSFAAPVQGNPTYSQHFNQLVPLSWRVLNSADIVPELPLPVIFAPPPGQPCVRGNCPLERQLYQHCGTTSQTYVFNSNLGDLDSNHVMAYSQHFLGENWPRS